MLLGGFIVLTGFKSKSTKLFAVPKGWPQPVYDFKKHPLDERKVELGHQLFYDPILSRDSTVSCISCHLPNTAFTHVDHALSHGIEGRIGTRNSPSLANMAWSKSFMWDGAVSRLNLQPLLPISNHDEMDENMEHVAAKLQANENYVKQFSKAFGDKTITREQILESLTQFVLTMVSATSKYDKVKQGEASFTEHEQNGYKLFQQHCAICHAEPLFTTGGFENNGLSVNESLKDCGLMKTTGSSADSLKFKIPTLRNIEYTYPYMHDGRFKNLSQVLNNYIMGLEHGPTLSPHLQNGIYLTNVEKGELIAFLYTLTDKEFMNNPKFSYPKK